jgi:phage-related protein
MDLSTSYTIKAQVTGQNEIGGLTKGLGKLQTSTNKTSAAMNKLKTAAGNAFGALRALAPAIGVAGLGKLVNDTLELGDMLQKLSVTSGVSVEMLDKLRISSQLAGTDFKALQRAFPVLAKNMQDASDGVGTAKEAFDRIGFSAVDSTGKLKSMDQALLEISDLMSKTKDNTLNLANASEIFGAGVGRKLVPLLKEGSAAIQGINSGFSQKNAEKMAAFNDKVTLLGEKFNVLKIQLTDAVLPALTKLVEIIGKGAETFAALPGPIKAISIGLALLLPAIVTIVPLFAAMVVSIKAIAAVKLGAVFAAITPAIGGVVTAVGGLITAFAPFLAAAAIPAAIIGLGVLIFKFRDQIGSAMVAIGQALLSPFTGFVDFVGNVFRTAVDKIRSAFMTIPNAVKSAISAATAPLRSFLSFINRILSRLARLRRKRKSSGGSGGSSGSGSGSGTPMALGGVVTSPTLGYLGEAGSEYVIPARKAAQFSKNYLAGYRGSSAVPRFAEGGYVSPNINITTGAVTQMDGTNFITTNDLANAVQSGIDQTLTLLQSDLRTRRSLGLG